MDDSLLYRPKMNYANFPSQEKIHFPQVGVSIALVMDCSCKVLGEECDIRKLGIRYHDPRAFVESAGLPRPLLAVLRLLYAALITTDLIWVGLDHPQGQWIIHFINWSRVFVGLYFLMGAITQLHPSLCRSKDTDHYDKIKQPGERLDHSFVSAYDSTSCGLTPGEEEDNWGAGKNRLSWYHEVLWVLHTIAADTSFVCTVAYFSLFFEQRYTWDGLLDIPRHVLYLLFMIIDTLCCYIPVRLLHVVYANIFGAAYIVFTLIFLLTEVKADLRLNPIIYPSLESENKPLLYTAYLSIFLIGCFPVSQAFFFLLYKFRAWVTST